MKLLIFHPGYHQSENKKPEGKKYNLCQPLLGCFIESNYNESKQKKNVCQESFWQWPTRELRD